MEILQYKKVTRLRAYTSLKFQLKNHTLEFKHWAYGTILDNIPMEVNEMITEFQEQFKTTDTKPVPIR